MLYFRYYDDSNEVFFLNGREKCVQTWWTTHAEIGLAISSFVT